MHAFQCLPGETDDLWRHPAVKRLSEYLDLEHSCGFVTMTNSGKPYKSQSALPFTSSGKRKQEPNSVSNSDEIILQDGDGVASTKRPGGQMLTEQESMDGSTLTNNALENTSKNTSQFATSADRKNLTINLTGTNSTTIDPEDPGSDISKNWSVMDCSFGVPLFSVGLNKEVCERIENCGLCSPSR